MLTKKAKAMKTPSSSASQTASNLRWRARVSKEAHDDDDSTAATAAAENVGPSWWGTSYLHAERRIHRTEDTDTVQTIDGSIDVWSATVYLVASTAVSCTFYALQTIAFYSIWWSLSLCLILFFAVLTVWQQRQLALADSLWTVYNRTRKQVRTLRQQNERFKRSLTSLDRSIEQLRTVQGDLQQYCDDDNDNKTSQVDRLIQTLRNFQHVQQCLREKLQQQVQQQILQALLQTDRNRDFQLTGSALERLIRRLQSLPGVDLHEEHLRDILAANVLAADASSSPDENNNNKSVALSSVVRLLRQVGEDARKSQQPAKTRTMGVLNSDDHDDDSIVFEFHPRQLLNTEENLIELE